MNKPKPPPSIVFDNALLKQFINGNLEPDVEERVAAHLESRPELLAKVAAVSGDGFVQRLKQAKQRSIAGNSIEAKSPIRPAVVKSQTMGPGPTNPSVIAAPKLEFPGYELIKELGRGGMGVVYLAKNIEMDRMEVLKVLSERLLNHAGAEQRFKQEIRAVSKLNHPNIVTSYNVLRTQEQMAFAMEYVHGLDLHQYIHKQNQKQLPIGVACSLARQMAAGLQHAHEKGLVHRDIKPSNAMLYKSDGQLQLKILDFGLAKATSEKADTKDLTQDGTMLGTPEYMAPEQMLNAAKADIRADIYSLGCTLYHMLAGKAPFGGTQGEIMMAHAQKDAVLVNLIRTDVPVELAAQIAKMMAKDVSKRFQTPSQVSAALKPFVTQAQGPLDTSPSPIVVAGNTVNETNASERDTSVEIVAPNVADVPVIEAAPLASQLAGLVVDSKRKAAPPLQPRPLVRKKSTLSQWWPPIAAIGLILFGGGLWLSGVFTFKTPEGTIIVENMPEDAEVQIDGQKVGISWNEGKDKVNVSIASGSHQLRVLNKGNEIYGSQVSVRGGVATVVNLRIVDAPVPIQSTTAKPLTESLTLPSLPTDKFTAGSVWEGNINFQKGGSVSYFLHVREFDGIKFKGHKFDNGRNRNYVQIEGQLTGDTIIWSTERSELIAKKVSKAWGTCKDGTIDFTFRRESSDGKLITEGNGKLTLKDSVQPGISPISQGKVSGAANTTRVDSLSTESTVSTRNELTTSPPKEDEIELPIGEPIDLFEMVQLPQHAIFGDWKRVNTDIVNGSADSVLMVPVALSGNYQLNLTFTPNDENFRIALQFPVGDTSCELFIDDDPGTFLGLNLVDKTRATDRVDNSLIRKNERLSVGGKHDLNMNVVQAGGNVQIQVLIDRLPVFSWDGAASRLSQVLNRTVPISNCVAVKIDEKTVTCHSLELHLSKGGRGYKLNEDWKNPLMEVLDVPSEAVSKTYSLRDWKGKKYLFTDEAMSLPDAQLLAVQVKGRLLTIGSAEEEKFVHEQGQERIFWMSGWCASDRKWKDDRNRPLRYFGKWAVIGSKTQPDNFNQIENRLVTYTGGTINGWNDSRAGDGTAVHACIEWGEEYAEDKSVVTGVTETSNLIQVGGNAVARNNAAALDLSSKNDLSEYIQSSYPLSRIVSFKSEKYETDGPDKKINEMYVKNGTAGIRSDGGWWGWDFTDLGTDQLFKAKVRVRNHSGGKVGISFKHEPIGVAVWLHGDRTVSFENSIFSKAKAKEIDRRFSLPDVVKPPNEWNELICILKNDALVVFVNGAYVGEIDLHSYPIPNTNLSFTIGATASNTIVEMTEYEIFSINEP